MGLTMKNFNVLGVHWKTQFLGGGVHWKTNIEGGDCLKVGGLGQFADLWGAWQEWRGWCFWEGGWHPNAHYGDQTRGFLMDSSMIVSRQEVTFLDISNAFEKVWPKDLLYKLKQNRITGNLLSFITNFLCQRK